jgi:ferredoxin
MKPVREVIRIDENKCNGCGQCIPNCPEGALQVIDGKVRLISDLFCDGLGACLGHCAQGAITVEKRQAEPYDERKVMVNVVKGGQGVIAAHLAHLRSHSQMAYLNEAVAYLKEHHIEVKETEGSPGKDPCGCPGSRVMVFDDKETKADDTTAAHPSELRQWPIQLQLLNPHAPYFKDADLVVVADCVPFAYPDFHRRFLKGKTLVMFCPKLDKTLDAYVEKLAEIFKSNTIKSVSIVHMEVPCCFGVENIVRSALEAAGKNGVIKEYTISLKGDII